MTFCRYFLSLIYIQSVCNHFSNPFSTQDRNLEVGTGNTLKSKVFWGVTLYMALGKQLACVWNVMSHAQKPDFVFRRNGWAHLNRWGCQFSRLLEAEVCASAVVMLDTPCSEVVWKVLATHPIRQFSLHFLSRACCSHLSISTGWGNRMWRIFRSLFWWIWLHATHKKKHGTLVVNKHLMYAFY